jgi:fused signal recognition particle receptor
MGIFEKFKLGFKKSANNIASGLREIIIKKEIDDETLDKIEEFLISSDVGIDAASEIKDIIAQRKIDPKNDPIIEVNNILEEYIIQLMQPLEKENFFKKKQHTNIILISGVNGVGKTTTIGKLGKIFKENNNKILFSACDTFRAAAIEQLEEWSNKVDATIIKSNPGSDPASVAFKAIEHAKQNNFDLVLIDTAGRLQNKKNLMEEFKKIGNVIKKK